MTSPIQLYEALTSAPDDKTRARIIAEAFERMEERYPEVKDLATRTALSETELRLQKEIEITRKEIEITRKEIAEIEGRLRLEIEQVRTGIAESRASIVRWVVSLLAGQTVVLIAALFAIAGR
ncbi:MAG: DUF1640 domain-containing protein [Gammaproteobacteria bacterium]|nr:DUF1640 domain-containing protein [Gammaproteobacteria bacterium]